MPLHGSVSWNRFCQVSAELVIGSVGVFALQFLNFVACAKYQWLSAKLWVLCLSILFNPKFHNFQFLFLFWTVCFDILIVYNYAVWTAVAAADWKWSAGYEFLTKRFNLAENQSECRVLRSKKLLLLAYRSCSMLASCNCSYMCYFLFLLLYFHCFAVAGYWLRWWYLIYYRLPAGFSFFLSFFSVSGRPLPLPSFPPCFSSCPSVRKYTTRNVYEVINEIKH